MSRDERITVYVSAEEKKHLQSEADDADETLSSYVYKLMQQQRHAEGLERAATETNAEERIEALIAEGREEIEEIAEDVRDMNARAGVYSIANFELLKQNYPDARRREVLETGARRLRYPLEAHPDLSDDEEEETDQDDERAPVSERLEDDGDESDENDDRGETGVEDLL